MVERWRMGTVLAGGLAIALSLGWAIFGRDGADVPRLVSMLESRCLPFVLDGRMDTSGYGAIPAKRPCGFGDPHKALLSAFDNSGQRRRCTLDERLNAFGGADLAVIIERPGVRAEGNHPLDGGKLVHVDPSDKGMVSSLIGWRPEESGPAYNLRFSAYLHADPLHVTIEPGHGTSITDAPTTGGIDA